MCDQISSNPNFQKFISGLHGHPNTITNKFQEIQQQKFFMTEIHGESHPISMCILVTYLTTWYFSCEFSCKCIVSNTT